jgi:hypothetical protein
MDPSEALAIDAHVHLHDPAEALATLAAVARRLAARQPGRIGVLMLAERSGFDVFEGLRGALTATDDPEALWFDDSRKLLVLAGRQVVSIEGLEILGLATSARPSDGLTADETIACFEAADALTVLPWGVGKWIGARGRLVDRLVAAARPGRLFLGDIGGRPAVWRVPRFGSGPRVLWGVDPLPIPRSEDGIAAFGTLAQIALSPERPAASLKRGLRDPATPISRYGAYTSALKFVSDQVRWRLRASGARR